MGCMACYHMRESGQSIHWLRRNGHKGLKHWGPCSYNRESR